MRARLASARLHPAAVLFAVLALALFSFEWSGQSFYLRLLTRASILAVAALALDFIVGLAGLVSLGHAAFLGVGAYTVGVLAEHGIHNAFVQWPVALGMSAAVAFLVGALSLTTRGVHFIMITLAFAQMLYFAANSISRYGGNDGLTIWIPSEVPGIGSLAQPSRLAWCSFTILLLVYLGLAHIRVSQFGRVLRASKENERRMLALGYGIQSYRLAAFVLSGIVTGLAGVLLANLTEFVSPAYMSWHRSGELLAIVVLGGLGSLHGAIIAAFVFTVLEEALSRITEHWAIFFGSFLVLAVLTRRGQALVAKRRRGSLR